MKYLWVIGLFNAAQTCEIVAGIEPTNNQVGANRSSTVPASPEHYQLTFRPLSD